MISKIIKSPKFMWIVGGVLVWWFFGPSIPGIIRHAFISRPSPSVQASSSKDKNARVGSSPGGPAPLPAPAAANASAADQALNNLMGTWEGTLPMNQEPCKVSLELREDHDKPGQFLGYSKLSCQPTMLEIMQRQESGKKMTPAEALKKMADAMKPSATNFTGVAEKGAIKLTAQNTFGLTGSGCSIATFTLMPAGSHDMGTEFTENAVPGCEGGELVMNKAR